MSQSCAARSLFRARRASEKDPRHSLSPLMSSISFPHSTVRPSQPLRRWRATVFTASTASPPLRVHSGFCFPASLRRCSNLVNISSRGEFHICRSHSGLWQLESQTATWLASVISLFFSSHFCVIPPPFFFLFFWKMNLSASQAVSRRRWREPGDASYSRDL